MPALILTEPNPAIDVIDIAVVDTIDTIDSVDTKPVAPMAPESAEWPVMPLPVGEAQEVSLPRLVSEVYGESAPPLRRRLLECLLTPIGPLALTTIAAGAFGSFLYRSSWSRLSVSFDDTMRLGTEQVFELARFVEQYQPEVFGQLGAVMADHAAGVRSLSGSLLLAVIGRWMTRRPGATR